MIRSVFILVLIAILAALGAAAALKIMSWFIGVLLNVAIMVLAFVGIVFLIKKLRT